jgi:hypothetical protein
MLRSGAKDSLELWPERSSGPGPREVIYGDCEKAEPWAREPLRYLLGNQQRDQALTRIPSDQAQGSVLATETQTTRRGAGYR